MNVEVEEDTEVRNVEVEEDTEARRTRFTEANATGAQYAR